MANPDARQLMDSAWDLRRTALDADPTQQRVILEEARALLRRAIAASATDGAEVQHAHALHLLANVEADAGDRAAARQLWEESVTLLRASDDPLQLAHKLRHLGDLLREQGDLEAASVILDEALALYREHTPTDRARPSETLDLANAVRRVALLREAEHRPEAAVLWTEARELYGALGLGEGVDDRCKVIEVAGLLQFYQTFDCPCGDALVWTA